MFRQSINAMLNNVIATANFWFGVMVVKSFRFRNWREAPFGRLGEKGIENFHGSI